MTAFEGHTPGPWEVERGFRDAFSHAGGHTTVQDDFITVHFSDESDEYAGEDCAHVFGPRAEANAALIGVAPALLSALRAIIAHWDEFGPEHGFGEVIDQARARISGDAP